MKINKLTATFGKLNGETLELKDGLNIICAPNESGKSTWCAFIRAMLYGVDSSERVKGGVLPDKTRYAPWSGAEMQGEMQLTEDGRDITLTRTTKLKTAPMREFSAVYTGTNVEVKGLDASSAGEILTGVTKDVFRKSAFIEQGAIAVTGSAELEKRISSIVSSGDEDCSYTEADDRLRAWQRARRYNRRGRLPDLESAIDEKRRTLKELRNDAKELEYLTQELGESKAQCARLENEMMESRKRERLSALSELHDMRGQNEAAESEHAAAEKKLTECRAEIENCPVTKGKTPQELKAEVAEDTAKCREKRGIAEEKVSNAPQTVMLIAGLALAVLSAFVFTGTLIAVGCALAAVLCVAAVGMFLSCGKKRTRIGEAKADLNAILEKYGVDSEDDIAEREREYLALYEALYAAAKEEEKTAQELYKRRSEYEIFESSTVTKLDFASGSSEAVEIGRKLADMRGRCELLGTKTAEIRGRINAVGDPMVLSSELLNMESERAQLEAEYEAIALALDTLREADADIQSRFSPELGRLAAHYMSLVTDGKYENVLINRDFTAKTKSAGDTVARDTGYLSAGTLDLMYLAVRLAVCRLALPEGKSCPLVLDDTLVNFDNERTQQAIKLLSEIAKERQVILFTCKEI